MLRRIHIGVVLTLMLMGGAIAWPFEDGVAACRRGDYVATAGGAGRCEGAQITVGTLYAEGLGVPQDYASLRHIGKARWSIPMLCPS
jgi:hypothetical protein